MLSVVASTSLLARTTTRSTSRLLLHRTFAAPAVQEVTTADKATKFLEKHDKSVFYFTAVWCPPCKAIKPVYEQLAEKYTDVAFAKLDVDENQDSAADHQISAVPTFIFFDGDQIVNRFSGADPNQLESLIQDLQAR